MEQKTQWQSFDDAVLVKATKVGSNEAFDELTRRYRGTVRGVAYSIIGRQAEAEDIAQDALLIAYRSIDQLTQPQRFGNWLYTIVRHRALRFLRTRKKEALVPLMEHEPNFKPVLQSIDDPAEVLDQKEAVSYLERTLGLLPTEYRIVLELRYWRNEKTRRISAILGLPETTVKWRLHTARNILAQKLNATERKET